MKVYDLLNKMDIKISSKVDIDIFNVTCDSRKCNRNSLYINLYNEYLNDAVNNGVKLIVSEKYIEINDKIVIYVKDIKKFYYSALKCFYKKNNGFTIGVTGTCGKTTTVTLLYETLKYLNKDLLLISSNGNYTFINEKEEYYETINTTPNIEIIYELIDKYKYDYVIIEVSSQGIMNKRIEDISFDIACFLNLSNDHLDYHKTLSNYLNAKIKLFKNLKSGGVGLVNYHSKFKNLFYLENIFVYTFGINEGDYQISYLEPDLETMKIKIGDKYATSYLTGDYNAENISCANAVLSNLNIDNKYLIKCLNNGFKVDGRFDVINYRNNKIIIDFAHTEKEVERLLKHVNDFKFNKRYIIIGCGGDRDKSKRPIFGKLAVEFADFVIFTEDNSRSELTTNIIADMIHNLDKNNYISILNRYRAIKYGISLLKENDVLLIIGKGVDKTKCYDKYLSDFEIVEEVINNVNK